ncbi:hypothetical protein HYPSUDRAFT_46635 [Hypholoma sublateritium FD-334 SS-4]|uniref:Uncharacterized protein n=1 Tax=Hypholoma sublateritium (strain FD-334 SS-4) TaxID=945553 RepID=A0A0D2KRP3_HYPSF|nr:hypothetical protein HYPSUDRAFT_46635 [Hypholoma sublateritium FD-334 SS-4]
MSARSAVVSDPVKWPACTLCDDHLHSLSPYSVCPSTPCPTTLPQYLVHAFTPSSCCLPIHNSHHSQSSPHRSIHRRLPSPAQATQAVPLSVQIASVCVAMYDRVARRYARCLQRVHRLLQSALVRPARVPQYHIYLSAHHAPLIAAAWTGNLPQDVPLTSDLPSHA